MGVPKRLVVGIDPSRGNGNWQLFKVTVKSPRLPREYVFWADTDEHCDGWLGKGARDGKSERTLTEGVRDPNSASYTFEVGPAVARPCTRTLPAHASELFASVSLVDCFDPS